MPGRSSAPPPHVCPACRRTIRQAGPTAGGEAVLEAWPDGAWKWEGETWRRVGKGRGSFRLHQCYADPGAGDNALATPAPLTPDPEQLALV